MNSVNLRRNQLERKKLREIRNKTTKKRLVASALVASLGLSVFLLWNSNFENANADSASRLSSNSISQEEKKDIPKKIVGYRKVKYDEIVYSSISENPKIISHLKSGDYVGFYGEDSIYSKITHNGVEGYVRSESLESPKDNQLKVVDGYLLISKDYTVPRDFKIRFDIDAENAMMVMFEAMARENLKIGVSTKEFKEEIIDNQEDGEISAPSIENSILRNGRTIELEIPNEPTALNFSSTEQGKWLKENAHKYGFVLVYPVEKEIETGFFGNDRIYTFVGIKVANEIVNNNITLEQYFLSK